jgi:class 3 adenylate cyclase
MPQIRFKTFAEPDEARQFPFMDSQLVNLGPIAIGHATLSPGWRWTTSIGPKTGDALCQVHHVNLVVSGRIRFALPSGEEAEIGPMSVVDVPPGHDAWVVGDEPVVMFDLFGNAADIGLPAEHERVVTTVLISDIVESTATAHRMGDGSWRQLLAEHDRMIRTLLDRYGGHEVKTTGDGFVATFPSAIASLRCATAMRDGAEHLGLRLRIGINTGEVEVVENDIRGVAVHAAARIMALAEPSEVLVADMTRQLASGAGLVFDNRGAHELKGFDQPMTVYGLAR